MTTPANLDFTGERYVPSLTGQIRYEHLHRYAIAARIAGGRRVLDIACGEGYGSALLARSAGQVVGVDADERSIRHARASYFAANLRFAQGSCTELPLGDGAVDVVASFETIEHLSEHERMLDEIRRVLTPGGVLVMSSPNKLVYSDLAGFTNPFHERELYFADFRELLARRFPYVALYGQRVTALSIVHPLASAVSERPLWYSGDPAAIRAELPALPAPMYFIAVASDAPIDLTIESAFVDPADDLLEDMWTELNTMRRQTALGGGLSSDLQDALPGGAAPALPAGADRPGEPSYEDLVRRLMELEEETQQLRVGSELHQRRAAVEFDTATRLQTLLQQREAEIADYAATLAQRDAALAAREAELAAGAADLAALQARQQGADQTAVEQRAALAESRALLQARDAALADCSARLAAREAELVSRGAALAARDAALAECDAQQLAAEEAAAEQRAALGEALAQFEHERAAAAEAVAEQRAALGEALAQFERERAAAAGAAAEQSAALAERERERRAAEERAAVAEEQATMAVERAAVAEERATRAEERAAVAEERATMAEERATGAQERAAVAEQRLAELAALEAAREAEMAAAAAATARAAARADELARQGAALADERARLEAELAAARGERAVLLERVQLLEHGIGDLRAVQDELAQRAATESETLQDVLSSRSWRLTYPLRAAGTVLRGRAGRA